MLLQIVLGVEIAVGGVLNTKYWIKASEIISYVNLGHVYIGSECRVFTQNLKLYVAKL